MDLTYRQTENAAAFMSQWRTIFAFAFNTVNSRRIPDKILWWEIRVKIMRCYAIFTSRDQFKGLTPPRCKSSEPRVASEPQEMAPNHLLGTQS